MLTQTITYNEMTLAAFIFHAPAPVRPTMLCVCCNEPGRRVEPHHIDYVHDLCVWLCRGCHFRITTVADRWWPSPDRWLAATYEVWCANGNRTRHRR